MYRSILFATLFGAFAGTASAHTMEKSISIEDGAVLAESPKTVAIEFKHKATLGSAKLETATGEVIALPKPGSREASERLEIVLPPLAADTYDLSWRVMAADGHVMTGGISFTVKPATVAK